MKLKTRRKRQKRYGAQQRRRFARQCAEADQLRFGSIGAASEVRMISPNDYVPAAPRPSSSRPKSKFEIAAEQRKELDFQAGKITGISPSKGRKIIYTGGIKP